MQMKVCIYKDFPYPVGNDMKESFPCMKVVAAIFFSSFRLSIPSKRAHFSIAFLRLLHTAF